MARRQVLFEPLNDFRGGLNTLVSPDRLNLNELVQATNARLTVQHGALAKRTGTRRVHTTAIGLGNPVTGVFQWTQDNGTRQLVAIANGNLYHKTTEFGDFTEVVPASPFSTSKKQSFEDMRSSAQSAVLQLYIADGTYQRWTGSALTNLVGLASVPPADIIRDYHTRMLARHQDFIKSLFWSVVGDPEDFTSDGDPLNGGSALANTAGGENVRALEVLGNSLVIAFEDAIARFSGYSYEDFQLAQDTEGISSVIGTYNLNTLKRVEEFVVTLADRGPYIVTESGITAIGTNVDPEFDGLDRANLINSVIGYHKGRREVWFAVPGIGDSGENRTVYVWNLRLQSWTGPFTYPFGITCFSNYEDNNGDEFLVAGCEDGFVRHMDTGALDDVLSSGSGGTAYTMTVELAPVFTSVGPGFSKVLRDADLEADLSASSNIQVGVAFDNDSFADIAVTGLGEGQTLNYPVPLSGRGRRLRIRFTDDSATVPIINGIILRMIDYRRPE